MKSARDLISALFDKQTGVLADRYSSLFSGWKRMAGDDIAAHSAVKDIQNGALLIEVDHPGWVQMIRLKERSILSAIQKRYPELEIRMIKIFTLGADLPVASSPDSPSEPDASSVEELKGKDSEEYREFQSLLGRLKKIKSPDNRDD